MADLSANKNQNIGDMELMKHYIAVFLQSYGSSRSSEPLGTIPVEYSSDFSSSDGSTLTTNPTLSHSIGGEPNGISAERAPPAQPPSYRPPNPLFLAATERHHQCLLTQNAQFVNRNQKMRRYVFSPRGKRNLPQSVAEYNPYASTLYKNWLRLEEGMPSADAEKRWLSLPREQQYPWEQLQDEVRAERNHQRQMGHITWKTRK